MYYHRDAVALLTGQRTYDSQVTGLSLDWAPWRCGLGQCASVTKQYNLVLAKGDELFRWESNCGPGGK